MPLKLWLDPVIPAPVGWHQVIDGHDAIAALDSIPVDVLSLGIADPTLFAWLDDQVRARRWAVIPEIIRIHTSGADHDAIASAIDKINRLREAATGSDFDDTNLLSPGKRETAWSIADRIRQQKR